MYTSMSPRGQENGSIRLQGRLAATAQQRQMEKCYSVSFIDQFNDSPQIGGNLKPYLSNNYKYFLFVFQSKKYFFLWRNQTTGNT